MQQVLKWVWAGLLSMFLASCHDHNLAPVQSEHTLLIYICGDNSLSSFADRNIQACKEGLLNSTTPLNLIIYKDNDDYRSDTQGKPCLFQLKPNNKSGIDTIYIKKWGDEVDSSDPAILSEVLSTAFHNFDTHIKGLEIWGHGHSWIPGSTWNPEASSRASQFAAVDSKNYLEIWEMREAIEKTGMHFDYIQFDACFMGSAEVAYELRNVCDWMIGSTCELPDKGFPYDATIAELSQASSAEQGYIDLPQALKASIDAFQQAYPDKSAITLFNEKQMEALHSAYRKLVAEQSSVLEQWADSPYLFDQEMQHYGRSATNDRYHFYDLADYAKAAGGDLTSYINRAVKHYYSAGQYYDGAGTVTFKNSCGICITPPQLFSIGDNPTHLTEGYKRIGWSKE